MTAARERLGLPQRNGTRPLTRPHNPHQQLSDNAPPELQDELWARMTTLHGIVVGRSNISLPDTRALHLEPELAHGPSHAYLAGTEFAHLHGRADGSLHMSLPDELAAEAIARGWAEQHPMAHVGYLPAQLLMVYGPRDDDEVDWIWQLVVASYEHALGGTRA